VRCTPESVDAALRDLDAQQLRRRREIFGSGVDFCSNDYLGLAAHPDVAAAMANAALAHGVGARASHLVNGHDAEHEALERELAEFTGRERALLFSTGYMANLGVVGAFADRDDLILEDRLNHASLLDAGLLARTRAFERYAHCDADAAAAVLRAQHEARPNASAMLVTDGVFSMDGDLAPLPQLAAATRAYRQWLVVDDAHGFGVLGKTGGGCCEHFGLGADDIPLLVGTLGKAFGTFGAFVAGDAAYIELLMQRARTYIYTTALPPAVAAATRVALRLLRTEHWRRERLHAHIQRFRDGARRCGLPLADSPTAIQPVIIGSARDALTASRTLADAGFRVVAIRPPTVPAGSARLRVTLSATHTETQIDDLLSALEGACDAARRERAP